MSRWWAWLLLLLMAINAGAELYLLKHGDDLYCASDDEDTPALAWNHDINRENEPLETVYWSKPAPYSAINCKPEFGERKCGNWDIFNWRIVNSYERDFPPIFDFRWNDLRRYVEPRGELTGYKLFQPPATQLYLPVSLLVRDNAIIVLRNESWDWRIIIDGWITSEPRMEVELWNTDLNDKTKQFRCDTNCSGLILHNGTRWTTFTIKYEARREGDILNVFNHETGVENTWTTNETLTAVKNRLFYTYGGSPGLLGHWRFHSYNILEPTQGSRSMSFKFYDTRENQLCISITYIAPQRYDAGREAYVQLNTRNQQIQKTLHATGNQWKTVKLAFSLTTSGYHLLGISPPESNIKGFAIREIRACSEGVHDSVFTTEKSEELCVAIIPNVRDCRGVTLCDSSVCTCAPGFQGPDCQPDSICPNKYYGDECLQECSTNCGGDGSCNRDTGQCIHGCVDNWTGDHCIKCEVDPYGLGFRSKCSGECNAVDGHCPNGCEEGFIGDKCDSKPLSILSIVMIFVGALAFVLMGLGLIFAFVWIFRLRRKERSNTISPELQERPQQQIGSALQSAGGEVQGVDSVLYDNIPENVEYETFIETGPGSSLDVNLETNSVRFNILAASVPTRAPEMQEGENGYLYAISAQAGSSGQQNAIPIRPGDMGSPYADVLNLADNQIVNEYEYIRIGGKKL